MKSPKFILFVFLTGVITVSGFISADKQVRPQDTQSAPQGMVLVDSDSLQPFYISVIEEPNINWQVYVEWLKGIFVSYPEVYKQALPRDTMTGLWQYYNDPLLDNYFEHPAYQWYPVTGVSWMQVREYMEWKTDRLNEMILDKTGIHEYQIRRMIDADNFTAEAYLLDLYELPVRRNGKGMLKDDPVKNGIRDVKASDGILFAHYRLPTEEEWESADDYMHQSSNFEIIKASLQKNNPLDFWIHYFNLDPGYTGNNRSGKIISFDNFHSGVSEWLLDHETFSWQFNASNSEILLKNGWKPITENELVLDNIRQDSLGKLPFRLIEMDNGGKFMSSPISYEYNYKDSIFPNPFYRKDSVYMDSIFMISHGEQFNAYRSAGYQVSMMTFLRFYGITPMNLIKDSMKRTMVRTLRKDNSKDKRKVKTGNFKKPGTGVSLMAQEASSPFVGFRCVLPYAAIPIIKKHKVKW